MRPHLSLDVRNVPVSVEFYQKIFRIEPQKQTSDYAKFDLSSPALNLSLVSSTGRVSVVNHLGIEVESLEEIAAWKERLQQAGVIDKVEENVACCFARQDKVWFTDPDGNAWEVFTVHEQLPVNGPIASTGCCVPSPNGGAKTCATEDRVAPALPSLALLIVMLVSFVTWWSNVASAESLTEYIATDYG